VNEVIRKLAIKGARSEQAGIPRRQDLQPVLARKGTDMDQLSNSKQLLRHPLSADYDDLKGHEWQQFVEGVRKFGVVRNRPITLHEGKVIDGWQLLRACVETGTQPNYVQLKLPDGMTVEQWVEIINDVRRHETQESREKRRAERIKRVAEARKNGQSLRTIAEDEGVSPEQVRQDIKTATVKGLTVEPHENKVKGRDGRTRTAAPKRPSPEPPPQEREPGDDTDVIQAEKRQNRADLRNQGKPVFDDRKITDEIGRLTRLFNERANALDHQKHPKYVEVRKHLNALHVAWEEWQK
jgi:hypothetical protein